MIFVCYTVPDYPLGGVGIYVWVPLILEVYITLISQKIIEHLISNYISVILCVKYCEFFLFLQFHRKTKFIEYYFLIYSCVP